MAAIASAAIIGGSSLLSGVMGKSAGNKAAAAATNAANLQHQQYLTTRGDLLPYNVAGQGALPTVNALAYGDPATTQAMLEKTPGYQFTLGQGLKATQASAAARGLGVSGAALKGAATYATGLADQTFEQRFNDALKVANLGENAAAQTGTAGTSAAATGGNYLNQAGQDVAAGTMAGPNALTSGLNNYLGLQAYQNALSTRGYGNPPAAAYAGPYTGAPMPYTPPSVPANYT